MAEWLWDTGFASVSADAPALEAWPPRAGDKYLHVRFELLLIV